MAEVKIDIKLTGLPAIQNQFRSITNISKSTALSIQQQWERTNFRIKQLEEDKSRIISKINIDLMNNVKKNKQLEVKYTEKAALQKEIIEKKYVDKVTRIKDAARLREKHAAERDAIQSKGGFSLSGAGHMAQVAGFYK